MGSCCKVSFIFLEPGEHYHSWNFIGYLTSVDTQLFPQYMIHRGQSLWAFPHQSSDLTSRKLSKQLPGFFPHPGCHTFYISFAGGLFLSLSLRPSCHLVEHDDASCFPLSMDNGWGSRGFRQHNSLFRSHLYLVNWVKPRGHPLFLKTRLWGWDCSSSKG